jgi:hypothetical protein
LPRVEEIIRGLQLIAKYQPDAEVSADHDVLYAGTPSAMPQAERYQMANLNWIEDKEFDAWKKLT